MNIVRSAKDFASCDGSRVQLEGSYVVEPMGRHRVVTTQADGSRIQSARALFLRLADGTEVRVGARPDQELDAFVGRRVLAIGRLEADPPRLPDHMAQMDPMPTLHQVESITLAP